MKSENVSRCATSPVGLAALNALRPTPRDRTPMPTQQRLRPHQEHLPRRPRQNPAERAQKHPVARRKRRPRNLPTQNRDFVSEHDDLQLLRRVPRAHSTTSPSKRQTTRYTSDTNTTSKGTGGRRYRAPCVRSTQPRSDRVCAPHGRERLWFQSALTRRPTFVAGCIDPPVGMTLSAASVRVSPPPSQAGDEGEGDRESDREHDRVFDVLDRLVDARVARAERPADPGE